MLSRLRPSLIDREEFPLLFVNDNEKATDSASPQDLVQPASNNNNDILQNLNLTTSGKVNEINPTDFSPYKNVPYNPVPIVCTPRGMKNLVKQKKSFDGQNSPKGSDNVLLGKSENIGTILQKNGITPEKFTIDSARKRFFEEKLKQSGNHLDFGTPISDPANSPKKKKIKKGNTSKNRSKSSGDKASKKKDHDAHMYEPPNEDENKETVLEDEFGPLGQKKPEIKTSGGIVPELMINSPRKINLQINSNSGNKTRNNSAITKFNNDNSIMMRTPRQDEQGFNQEPMKTKRFKSHTEEKLALRREIEEKRSEEIREKRELAEKVRNSRKTVTLADILKFKNPLSVNVDVLKEITGQETQTDQIEQSSLQKHMGQSLTHSAISPDGNNTAILSNIDYLHDFSESPDSAVKNINLNFMKNGGISSEVQYEEPDEIESNNLSVIRQSGSSPRQKISPRKANVEIEEAIRYFQAAAMKNKKEKAEMTFMIEMGHTQQAEENREIAAQIKEMKSIGKSKIMNHQLMKQDWYKRRKEIDQSRILERKKELSENQQAQKQMNEIQKQTEDGILDVRKRKLERIIQFVSQNICLEKQLLENQLYIAKQKQLYQNRQKVQNIKQANEFEKKKSEIILVENLNKQIMQKNISKQEIKETIEEKKKQELTEKRQQIIDLKTKQEHRKKRREMQRRQIKLVENLKQLPNFQKQQENAAALENNIVFGFKPEDLPFTNKIAIVNEEPEEEPRHIFFSNSQTSFAKSRTTQQSPQDFLMHMNSLLDNND